MKKDKLAIVGVGNFGLGFAIYLNHYKKYEVVAIDKNKERIKLLKQKNYHGLKESSIEFYTNIKKVKSCNIIFIFVDTPSLPNGNYDHSNILKIVKDLEKLSKRTIIICSTVMPGFCNSIKTKHDLAYMPQFASQGSVINDIVNPQFILAGANKKRIFKKIKKIYSQPFFSTKLIEAEIIKIGLNCFITMKITFANLIGDLCKSLNCDDEKVLKVISKDKRVGKKYFKYGYGYGGPCFPRDNKAMSNVMNKHFNYGLSKIIDESNEQHLYNQYNLIKKGHLPNNITKTDNIITITGLSFNQKSDMITESQPLKLALILAKDGYTVIIKDKKSLVKSIKKEHGKIFKYEILK